MSLFAMPDLDEDEASVLQQIDSLKERLRRLIGVSPSRWQGLLRQNTFARAIRGSNSIEGYHVSIEDALAAAVGEAPVEAAEETWRAITGYRTAMSYVIQRASDPHFKYSTDLIKSLHFMMLEYDLRKNPGRWRPGVVYVREEPTGRIVYEGPSAEQVPALMDELAAYLDANDQASPRIVAAMCHLNFVMIHPFSDGNGRMGRCLQSLVLGRVAQVDPVFASIEEYLGKNAPAYYQVLADVGDGAWHPERSARPWIRFCLTAHFAQAVSLLRRSKEYEKLWNILEEALVRAKLPERLALALNDAAMGLRVRNPTYRSAAEISDQVATKDLKAAVAAGYLVPEGERRGRYYRASERLGQIRQSTREPREVVDPFVVAARTGARRIHDHAAPSLRSG